MDEHVTLHVGDCLDVLETLDDASIDAVVTDPPYELNFMGRAWDASGIAYNVDVWRECLRVLKPGGHLVAFGGTRTYHRMTCAIEDAGFEIRDSLHWIYGSGFPKSLDVSKAIDKSKRRDYVLAAVALGLTIPGNNLHDWTKAEHSPGDAWWEKFKAHLSAEDWGRVERAVVGQRTSGATAGMQNLGPSGIKGGEYDVTAPATPDAARWQGWGTALKPAHEPIVLARKPLGGTVAATVLAHGTGALNIDGCRVGMSDADRDAARVPMAEWTRSGTTGATDQRSGRHFEPAPAGRWPANVILTHPPALDAAGDVVGDACADGCVEGCPVAEMDAQSGVLKSGRLDRSRITAENRTYGQAPQSRTGTYEPSEGGASRFFPIFRYQAKAPKSERPRLSDGTSHPTVKPLSLMSWLVRLVTPPGGLVLDPFAGSGTTGEAAALEGMRAVLIEMDETHAELIRARLAKDAA